MFEKRNSTMNIEAERKCFETQKETQRTRDALGQSNTDIIHDIDTKDSKEPLLPIDYFTKKGEEEGDASCKQKPDWALRIALSGMLLLVFMGFWAQLLLILVGKYNIYSYRSAQVVSTFSFAFFITL